jgi:hypothetical protein
VYALERNCVGVTIQRPALSRDQRADMFRPHVRVAHWHTFLTGAGRTERRVRWLLVIPVNVVDLDLLPATVRRLIKDGHAINVQRPENEDILVSGEISAPICVPRTAML